MGMEDFLLSDRDVQDARAALLKYYSSETIAHGAYLISLAVGFFGFVQLLPLFETIEALQRALLLGFFFSIFLGLVVHILGRTFFWGYLSSEALWATPLKESEVTIEGRTSATLLIRLHQACGGRVKQKHKVWGQFYYTIRLWELELWVIFFVLSFLFWYLPSL